jgi:hypothetical protein
MDIRQSPFYPPILLDLLPCKINYLEKKEEIQVGEVQEAP